VPIQQVTFADGDQNTDIFKSVSNDSIRESAAKSVSQPNMVSAKSVSQPNMVSAKSVSQPNIVSAKSVSQPNIVSTKSVSLHIVLSTITMSQIFRSANLLNS